MEPTDKKINGAFVGLTIIILILIVGGIYIWQQIQLRNTLNKINNAANQNSKIATPNDTSDLNNLNQEIDSTNTSVGVDANTVQ